MVFVDSFGHGSKWLAGIIDEIRGPLIYMVKLPDGRILKRHVDHIWNRSSMEPSTSHAIPPHEESLSLGPLLDAEEPQPEQPSQSSGQHPVPVHSFSHVRRRRPPDRFIPDP